MLLVVLFLSNCRHVRTSNQDVTKSVPEYHVASESFVLNDIEYIFYKYQVSWEEARVICTSREAHLVTFDAKTNIQFILRILENTSFASESFWIGAQTDSTGSWHWITTQRKLEFKNMTYTNLVFHETFEKSEQTRHCLSIDLQNSSTPVLFPSACTAQKAIICQRHLEVPNKLINLVTSVRAGEKEFTLYSGRAVWSEAVLHCRHEGLQIAEVETMPEAETIALIMLRMRPDAIENAWIGGYSDDSSWKWVTSGENITLASNLWRRIDKKEKAGCLLLDVHLSDPPVYLQSRCDRNRDVLCQRRMQSNTTGTATTAQHIETTTENCAVAEVRTTPEAYGMEEQVQKSNQVYKNTEEVSRNNSEIKSSTGVEKVSTKSPNDLSDTSSIAEISTYRGSTESITSASIASFTYTPDARKLFISDVQSTEETSADTVKKLEIEETTISANDEDYYNYVGDDEMKKTFHVSKTTPAGTGKHEDKNFVIVDNNQNEVPDVIDTTTEASIDRSYAKPGMFLHFLSIRPYYAFEGPMNVDITPKLDSNNYPRKWEEMKLENSKFRRKFHGATVINDIIVQIINLNCGGRGRH